VTTRTFDHNDVLVTECEECGHNVDGHDPENGCLQGWMSLANPGQGIQFCGCREYPGEGMTEEEEARAAAVEDFYCGSDYPGRTGP
jgi:hypothetical protein